MAVMAFKFVDQPIASPVVLFDMNRPDGTVFVEFSHTFDISPPPRKRSFTTNSMTDGGQLTGSAFDNRVLEFTIAIEGTYAQKTARLAAFMAQISKDRNLLMFTPKPGVIAPVFFRTMRSDDYTFVFRSSSQDQPWIVECKVWAEPFAIGQRIDKLTAATLTNDPASGTNPGRIDLTGIVGELPTPAFVRITAPGQNQPFYIAQRSGDGATFTGIAQCEAANAFGVDTATATVSGFSGAGTNAATATFATDNSLTWRAQLSWDPAVHGYTAIKGRYRALIRVASSVAGATYRLRLNVYGGTQFIKLRNMEFTIANTADRRIIDLGVFAWPPYEAPMEIGYSGLQSGAETIWVLLDAQRLSGSGSLQMDYMYLFPADERLSVVACSQAPDYLVLDGPNDMTYGMDTGSSPFGAAASNRSITNYLGLVTRVGGLPMLVPGVTNRLHIIQDLAINSNTHAVDVSYWPRYLEVATS
jgi:hypothetical protein